MPERFSLSCLCLLLAFFAALPASAQKAPHTPGGLPAPSVEEDQEPQPEPPRSVLNVEVKDDLLSVELENVNFGAAIREVGAKAGFMIEGTGEVFSRKLNTKFTDIEVERGVLRLLTLVKETNYMLHYDTKGMISKLEILGMGPGKAPAAASRQPVRPATILRQPAVSPTPAVSSQPQRPTTVSPLPQTRPVPPVLRRRPVPSRPMTPSRPAAQPSGPAKTQEAEEEETDNGEEESVDEIPYVPPQPKIAPGSSAKP